MVVAGKSSFGSDGMITYNKQKKEFYGVRIPGDMSYDYLRREIMLGTIPVNTIVHIGYIDYFRIYKPLLDCTNFSEVTENDNDSDDDDDDFDDYEFDLDNLDGFVPPASMNISLGFGGNQQNSLSIGGNSSSQTSSGGFSLFPKTTGSAPASAPAIPLTFNTGNQASQSNPLDNDIIQEMMGFKSLTVLHVAMLFNDDALSEYLLDNKVDVMKSTIDCGPIIFLAIAKKKLDYVKRILDSGFLLDYRAKAPELSLRDNYSALEVAVSFNHYKIIEFLISQGSEVNVGESNALVSPILVAAKKGNVKMMKFLIDHGAVVNEEVLTIACKSNMSLKVIKFLLNNPAMKLTSGGNNKSPNKPNLPGSGNFYENSILTWPMRYGYKNVVACLLNAGADVNVVNEDGKMIYEAFGLHKACVEMIKKHLIKLIVADFEVCDKNRKNVKGEEYAVFFAKCRNEVEVMKSIPVSGTDLTCYDLLRKEEEELTVCLKHFNNCIVLENYLTKIFPLYGRMLASRLKRCINQCN